MEKVRQLFKKKEMGILFILIITMIIITIGNTVFIRPDNIMDILTSNICLLYTSRCV